MKLPKNPFFYFSTFTLPCLIFQNIHVHVFQQLFFRKIIWMNSAPLGSRLINAAAEIMYIDEIKLFDCSSTTKLLKFEKLSHRPLPRAISVWGTKC